MSGTMSGDERAENIAAWLDGLAETAERKGSREADKREDFLGLATVHRARANDIRAGLDLRFPE